MNRTTAPLRAALFGAILLTYAAPPQPVLAQSGAVLIRADEIHTVTNGTIQNGEILVRDGVIQAVGTSVDAPADAEIYEARVVIPGMIDAHAHLAIDRSQPFADPRDRSPPSGRRWRTWIWTTR